MLIKKRRGWELPESAATPEKIYRHRREFLKALGLSTGSIAAAGLIAACSSDGKNSTAAKGATSGHSPDDDGNSAAAGDGGSGGLGGSGGSTAGDDDSSGTAGGDDTAGDPTTTQPGDVVGAPNSVDPDENTWENVHTDLYPAKKNTKYDPQERQASPPEKVTTYNNYYEFGTDKNAVWEHVGGLVTRPWTIEVTGLCGNPKTWDFDELVRAMPLEERVYRHRCVEAWSMTVPWEGFTLATLLDQAKPLSSAKYVRFLSLNRPEQMPGQAADWYPWPYYEGLRIDEAMHDLTFCVTGAYGKPLVRQNGAPLRLHIPWKYGYKSPKAIVKIEFTDQQPPTFWSTLVPSEYPFESNVDPDVAHPRWSQATEHLIDTGESIPTQKYNGYGEWVASLYK